MKSYFFKFILWQLWSIVASYVFMDEDMMLFAVFFFLVVDLVCFCMYFARKKRVNVSAFIKENFDILPYKWFWRLGMVGTISMMHWNEYFLLCCFLWLTLFVAFIVDTINRYEMWKSNTGRSLSVFGSK